jgi:hypothetical protein
MGAAATDAGTPFRSTAADRQTVEITVYNDGMGVVKELRGFSLPAGQGEMQFADVAARIDPASILIKPLSDAEDFTVLEQNFEYDLISHAKLMEKYIGKEIKIIDRNKFHGRESVINATVVSAAEGEVYEIDGEISLGHPGIKVLPKIPGNLISRPTLSWQYYNRTARDYQLEVSYVTGGMRWEADYVLFLADGDTAGAELSGWVTIDNRSGGAFEDAKLKLMAGLVNIVPKPEPFEDSRDYGNFAFETAEVIGYLDNPTPIYLLDTDPGFDDALAASRFEKSGVFEYHMYDLPRKTSIGNNQTKQIKLMEAHGLDVETEYVTAPSGIQYFGRADNDGGTVKQPVAAFLTFKNSKDNNLGNPLPGGTIRIYTADANGSRQFIGEDRIEHTPEDEEIRLRTGEAFDIVVERTQVRFTERGANQHETEWMISVRNRKNEDITVGVREKAYGQWEIRESSHEYVKIDAETFRFDVSAEKGQEVIIRYKVVTTF